LSAQTPKAALKRLLAVKYFTRPGDTKERRVGPAVAKRIVVSFGCKP
jgi:hypothetical protein